MIRAVLFDLDGTLHDRQAGLEHFVVEQYVRLGGCPGDFDRYLRRFVELDAAGRHWKDHVYTGLRREFAFLARWSVDELVAQYLQGYPGHAVEMPGARMLLGALRDRRLVTAIVTNGRADLQSAVIDALGLRRLADAVIVSAEVGHRKPEREIFEVALARLGVSAAQAVMVGDDPVADVAGARSADLRAIGFGPRCAGDSVAFAERLDEVLRVLS